MPPSATPNLQVSKKSSKRQWNCGETRPVVKLNTGSTSWENLADLKESHPLKTAKYAVTHGIDHAPASNWWVPHVLKKRDRIISLVCKWITRYLKRTHKFGIEVPKTVKEALALDSKNDNTL
jgi:hypothetical protein